VYKLPICLKLTGQIITLLLRLLRGPNSIFVDLYPLRMGIMVDMMHQFFFASHMVIHRHPYRAGGECAFLQFTNAMRHTRTSSRLIVTPGDPARLALQPSRRGPECVCVDLNAVATRLIGFLFIHFSIRVNPMQFTRSNVKSTWSL